jgi:putative sterol carrier protein
MIDLESRFQQLVKLIEETPQNELEVALDKEPGGIDGSLDVVFDKMAAQFNPAKAKGGRGVFQHEVITADGTKPYHLQVENGTCGARRGPADNADVVVGVALVDMLHMASGKLSGQSAFFTGKLKLRGNPFFGMKLGEWFDPI